MSGENVLFYAVDSEEIAASSVILPPGYRSSIWSPAAGGLAPPGMPLLPFGIWWLLHTLRVFRNRDYAISLIHHAKKIVHRSVITPGYFRFPFMGREDLQIGDTWTSDEHRGKGLATFALRHIVRSSDRPRRYWYVVDEENSSSIRVVEKAGFRRVGCGGRYSRFGMRLFGSFRIDDQVTSSCLPH